MSSRKGRWRPVKDAMLLLLIISIVSMMLTLHLQDGLGWLGLRTQIKIIKSDLSRNSDGSHQVIRVFDNKLAHIKRGNYSLTAGIPGNRPSLPVPIYHESAHHKGLPINTKTNHLVNGNPLPPSNRNHEQIPLAQRREDLNIAGRNYNYPDSLLTRLLSDKRSSVRDGYRQGGSGKSVKDDGPRSRSRSTWNVHIKAYEKGRPKTGAGQLPLGLSPKSDSAGKIFYPQNGRIYDKLQAVRTRDPHAVEILEKPARPKPDQRTAKEKETGQFHEEWTEPEMEKKAETNRDKVWDNGRLSSHSFNGKYTDRDSNTLRPGKDTKARVTYFRRLEAHPIMDPSNSSSVSRPQSLISGSDASSTTAVNETDPGISHGQDRTIHQDQAVRDLIRQIEVSNMGESLEAPSVMVRGSVLSIKHHLPLIESAFHKSKAGVSYVAEDGPADTEVRENVHAKAWSIVMCLNTTGKGDDCVVTSKGTVPAKTNIIPQLQAVLVSPQLLCSNPSDQGNGIKDEYDTKRKEDRGRWCDGFLPCYPVPNELRQSTSVQQDIASLDLRETASPYLCQNSSGVWLASAPVGTGRGRGEGSFIPCEAGGWRDAIAARKTINRAPRGSFLVPLPKDLLSLNGQSPLAWQVKVLVTSIRPARVYVHPSGLLWEGLASQGPQRHKKTLSLTELQRLLHELDSTEKSQFTTEALKHEIWRFTQLVQSQSRILNDESVFMQTPKSFQLFDAVFVFNSSFLPLILEVLPLDYQEGLSSLSEYLQEQNILEDLAPLILARDTTATSIYQALRSLGFHVNAHKKPCSASFNICLGQEDISFLLDTRREQMASCNWRRVEPNTEEACTSNKKMTLGEISPEHKADFLAKLVEMILLCPDSVTSNKAEKQTSSPPTESVQEPICCDDPSRLGQLKSIVVQPYLQLYPEFSHLNTEYQMWADYNTTLVNLQVFPAHCSARVKVAEVDDGNRFGSANLSLGLGENVVHIKVEVKEDGRSVTVATYRLVIYRRARNPTGHISADIALARHYVGRLSVCALKQDCALRYLPDESCGIMPWNKTKDGGQSWTWDQFLALHSKLPFCHSGNANDARWLVPCSRCEEPSTCEWGQAVWHQDSCQEARLSQAELQQCLTGKQVLFIGDSTNRGILNYITKRVNGSLLKWDKTHTMRVYSDLNQGRTVFAFAYYPQFWLDSGSRPFFDAAFSRLRNRAEAASNGQLETVLVLGGVHWLTRRHLEALQATLNREGLLNVKVVVKGHGAGFHQAVTGVRQLSLADQQKLYEKNQELMTYSRSRGYLTVDTFPMTMARYRDFLQGKCACHFHKVSAEQPSILSKLSPGSSSNQIPDSPIQYSVHGDINAAYSEMVINRICYRQG